MPITREEIGECRRAGGDCARAGRITAHCA